MIGIYSIYNSRRTILSNHCTTVIEKSTKKVKKKVFPQNPNIFSVGMGFHCKLPDFIAQNIIRDLRMNFELWVLWVPKLIPWQWHQPNTNKIGTNKIMAESIYNLHMSFRFLHFWKKEYCCENAIGGSGLGGLWNPWSEPQSSGMQNLCKQSEIGSNGGSTILFCTLTFKTVTILKVQE